VVEIIKRKDGEYSQKERLEGTPQISFNDYGHLVIRLIKDDNADSLIVLNTALTNRLINFCKQYLIKENLKNTIINISNLNIENLKDIPF
jgi:hypothetical protein